jgi:catechol 2,3-dioxygenase-like lactoylglutathione lyase family enzyme
VSVQLNHTIVSCRDQQRSAAFLTGILGLPPAIRFAHFLVVEADNGVSLDFAETTGAVAPSITPSSSARRNSMRPLAASVARTCRTGRILARPSPG